MLINEFRYNNLHVGTELNTSNLGKNQDDIHKSGQGSFSDILKKQIDNSQGVQFSKHAMDRINLRNINLIEGNKLERLNQAVTIAQEKGVNDTLILIDSTAFVVNIPNNKVITTMDQQDMKGNIFTNIDSTVII